MLKIENNFRLRQGQNQCEFVSRLVAHLHNVRLCDVIIELFSFHFEKSRFHFVIFHVKQLLSFQQFLCNLDFVSTIFIAHTRHNHSTLFCCLFDADFVVAVGKIDSRKMNL